MKSLFFLGLFVLAGCSSVAPKPLPSDTSAVTKVLETVNFTPFHSVAGTGESPTGERFHSFALKAAFKAAGDGASGLTVEQPPFIERDTVINELAAFRKKAEIYLVTSKGPVKDGSVSINGASTSLGNAEWILRERAFGLVLLAPYLEPGDTVSVSSRGSPIRFSIPKIFSPYLLARYETGAMMPTPMRGDTIVIDLDARTMSVVYRTSIPTTPNLRVAEFRLIAESAKPYPGSSLAETRARFESQQAYLQRCPIAETPVEPCAVPDHLPDRAFFE